MAVFTTWGALLEQIKADLADDAQRIRLVEAAARQWGRLDVLVNNAGISRVIPHGDLLAATCGKRSLFDGVGQVSAVSA